MPIMMLPCTGIETTVSRPITLDIANQVMDTLQIPLDTRIVFKGESDSVYQSGSLVTDKDNNPHTAGNSYLSIEVTERFLDESLGTIAVYKPEHIPYFFDDKLGISAKVVYIPTEVSINFKYRSRSKSLANKIRHDFWARVSNMSDVNVHTVTYNIPILDSYIKLLRYFHALRENIEGYNEKFEEYFLSYASPMVTQISRMDGKYHQYTLQETATRVLGLFDFSGAPEKAEKDSEGSTFTTEFTYKFTYEKPSNQVLKFPVAIHNQLVDQRLVGHQTINLDTKKKHYSSSIGNLRNFETDKILEDLVGKDRALYIPRYDDIVYHNKVPNTITLFSAICSVEDIDKKHLLNIKELGDFEFNPIILNYIEEMGWKDIFRPYESFILVSHYRNEHLADHQSVYIDKDLNFFSKKDLNKRVINRIRISIVKNILELNPDAIFRLLKYPEVLKIFVESTETNRIHLEKLRPIVDITHLFTDPNSRVNRNIGPPRSLWDLNRVQTNRILRSGIDAYNIKDHNTHPKKLMKLYHQIYGKPKQ